MTTKCFKVLSVIVLLLGCVAATWAQPFDPVDDAYNTLTDMPLSVPQAFGLSANDTTILNTIPAITAVDDTGLAGTLSVNLATGAFDYTPTAGFAGLTSFTYTVDDGAGGNTQATVTLFVGELENFCYVASQNLTTISGDPGLLARVDKAIGSSTIIGSLGPGIVEVETIAFGPGADTLFAVNADQLGYVDLVTGVFAPAANLVGSGDGSLGSQTFDDVDGLTFDPISRHLLGTVRKGGIDEDLLILIDRQTGQHVPDAFGPGIDYMVITGVLGDIDDIAYNPINRSIFAISNLDGQNDQLVNIDRGTGVATVLGTVITSNDMEGFGFDNSGLLYGTTGKDADIPIDRNSFWSLNVNNGLGTKINKFTYGFDYESCDCIVLPLLAAVDDRDTTLVDTALDIDVLSNDYLGEPITIITFPGGGATTQGGAVSVNDNGTGDTSDDFVTYTPPLGFSGIDTFEYTITDADNRTSTATVTIVVIGDSDGDGIPDLEDLDSDNDGIPDVVEACGVGATDFSCLPGGANPFADADNDGIPNYRDPDFCTLNANGVCMDLDSDGDGIIDLLDLDSDNDGIADVIEAGGTDADNNGVIDNFMDADQDGLADEVDNIDSGSGAGEVINGVPLLVPNSDTDGLPDYLDIDADNDGIIDNIEGQTTDGYQPPIGDNNGNGWDDAYDGTAGGTVIPLTNTDTVDNPDYLDPDSDNDTILDAVEGHDGNSNGIPDLLEGGGVLDTDDADNDGLYNSYDPDFLPTCDNTDLGQPGNGGCAPLQNTDGADDRDWRDTDDDNDGILTMDEPTDADGSGIPDYLEAFGDNDDDGINDQDDLDDDNDGIPDTEEACGPGAIDFSCLPGGGDPIADADGDGTPNYQDPEFCTLNANGVCDILDKDGDGIIDQFDLDSDNDGIPDVIEAGGTDADGDGILDGFMDDDKDGLADSIDPSEGGTPLPVPDSDGDGVPNYLDLDSDNDGITDVIEAGGPDADGDGRIDGFTDDDEDGLADSVDPTEGGTPLPVPNFDGDPYPDYIDIDADDDGIIDNIESQPTDGYRAPSGTDEDEDGYDDTYDPSEGGTPVSVENTDTDDAPDYVDPDTDDDSIPDNIEGHDSNSDGVPDITAGGSDDDNDGLDDAYDPDFIACSTTEQGQPGNGGCAAIQNTDGTDDRDWRDTDDDNDGDPSVDEGADDCDSDGIPDYLDDRDICDKDLEIYNGFSPNGDNNNDVWIIDGIEKFPNNTVKIYNRWGNLVWQTKGYDNQARIWRGDSNEGIILGDKMVPDGSYYYVIDLGNGSKVIGGYVVIHR